MLRILSRGLGCRTHRALLQLFFCKREGIRLLVGIAMRDPRRAVAGIVRELTDDKSLPKQERKRLQVEHAAAASQQAKAVKLADKICNLRDISSSPPADWSLERRREYFDWAKQVVDVMRGAHARLEQLFDAELEKRP